MITVLRPQCVSAVLMKSCLVAAGIFCSYTMCFCHPEISTSDDDSTVTVGDAPAEKVYVFGKSVVIKKHAKEVLAVGGDVTIEGQVDGDVATIGGNITQSEGAYVGGDIIVIGGKYKSESQSPLRENGKQTVVFGFLEDQLRNFGQNPSQLFSPSFSLGFMAQRIFVALLWFIISLIVTTIAPGAVSRAVARVQLSFVKICALGAICFIVLSGMIIGGVVVLPDYFGATLALMGILVLILGYLLGRVALQVSLGKLVQKNFLSENNRSETLATLIGVLIWTFLLSLPYVWILALFTVFAVGIGLILTARSSRTWKEA